MEYDSNRERGSSRSGPPSPSFSSFPVSFRQPNETSYIVHGSEDSHMEQLVDAPPVQPSFHQFFLDRQALESGRHTHRPTASMASDSVLEFGTDSSSFSEVDPGLGATFGNLTKLAKPPRPASRKVPRPVMIAATHIEEESELGYASGGPADFGRLVQEEADAEQRNTARGVSEGRSFNTSNRMSFQTANSGMAPSGAASFMSTSSEGPSASEAGSGESVRGLLIARSAVLDDAAR